MLGFRGHIDGFEPAVKCLKTLFPLLGETARVRGVAGCQVAFVPNFGRHQLNRGMRREEFSRPSFRNISLTRTRTPNFGEWDHHADVSFHLLRAAQRAIIPA